MCDFIFPLVYDTRGRVTDASGLTNDEWCPKRTLVAVDDTRTVQYSRTTENAYEQLCLEGRSQTVRALVEDYACDEPRPHHRVAGQGTGTRPVVSPLSSGPLDCCLTPRDDVTRTHTPRPEI